ncbi:MAG TPA: aldose epimerase family protein [Solirubrobacteraceae bacterium]|nr:aldose epimerase family protein [Solirubrobacteraceae bacterium]
MQNGFRSPRRLRTLVWARVVLVAAVLSLGTGGIAFAAKHSRKSSKHPTGHGSLSITHAPWGTANGQAVNLYTLRNGHGMVVKITNYGGVIQSIWVPDRTGALKDVALGFPKLSDYVNDFQNQPWPASGGSGDTYFGAIIGRYANRIANHSFTLDGTFYNLPGNNGPNDVDTLHGGPDAYNTQVWAATPETLSNAVALKLTYTDPNGKNGFPGAVANTVTYTLTQDNALTITYRATTTAPTVVNFTNHTYFNLGGEGSGDVYGQELAINSNTFQPTNSAQIPTGFASVAGTPFDFLKMKPIGQDIQDASAPEGNQLVIAHGYDHNWVLRGSGYRLDAVATDSNDGVALWEYTDQPGVQLYTGNFLVGDLVGTSGHAYRQGDAFTLETQHYPDTPHHIGQAGWPSVVLNPGQVFNSKTTYKFTTAGTNFRHDF